MLLHNVFINRRLGHSPQYTLTLLALTSQHKYGSDSVGTFIHRDIGDMMFHYDNVYVPVLQ